MERLGRKSQSNGSPAMEASRVWATVTAHCSSWLATSVISATTTHSYSRECLRSQVWVEKLPTSGEKMSWPILQVVLAPNRCGSPSRSGSRPCWRLLVYSSLDPKMTASLVRKLRSTIRHGGIDWSLYWLTPRDSVRRVPLSLTSTNLQEFLQQEP